MLLSVRHETTYAYEGTASQVTQILRLRPQSDDAQEVLDWRIVRSDGAPIAPYLDGFGNACSFSSRQDPGDSVVIRVAGRVRTRDTGGAVSGAAETLPPAYWMKTTSLTAPTEAIGALAAGAIKGPVSRAKLEKLAKAVQKHVALEAGAASYVETPADAALAAGSGPSQHHAHVFIAAARMSGVPARYVSGYVLPEGSRDAPFASHAWAEVWTGDAGWVGLDASRGAPVTESHVRVAIGLDYRQAAPISGFWRGAGAETMQVVGVVEALESGQ